MSAANNAINPHPSNARNDIATMGFAKRTFLIAGIYGLVVLLPQYLLEAKNGRDYPPAITHPEYYYGFIGIAVAWQIAFLLMAKNPIRYRPMMIPAIIEKATFAIAVGVLLALNRVSLPMLGAGFVDLVLGTLFILAYIRTRRFLLIDSAEVTKID